MDTKIPNLRLEDANLKFRNFMGREGLYNSAGDRNFQVDLPADLAAKLLEEGWNIKTRKVMEEGDDPQHYIQISVNYDKGRPPHIVKITTRGRSDMQLSEIHELDYADIKRADLVINPYAWEVNGNKGIKAYLKNAFITMDEDEFDLLYGQLPDANPTTGNTIWTGASMTANEEAMV